MIEQNAASDGDHFADDPRAGGITNVRVRRSWTAPFQFLLAFVVGVLLWGCLGQLVSGSFAAGRNPLVLQFAVGMTVTLVIVSHFRWKTAQAAKKVAGIICAARQVDFSEMITKALLEQPVLWVHRVVLQLAESLVTVGERNRTIRGHRRGTPVTVEPITVEFEPRLLNEADASFGELAIGTHPDLAARDSRARIPQSAQEDPVWRRLKRNIRMNGGWFLTLVFGFVTIMAVVDAWERRTVTSWLLWWTFCFAFLLLFPRSTSGPWSERQWLIVPGGLVLRQTGRTRRSVHLHVFNRYDSVLCVYERHKQDWLFAVADAQESGHGAATAGEIDLMLRAWLSPIPPPPVERLQDLA